MTNSYDITNAKSLIHKWHIRLLCLIIFLTNITGLTAQDKIPVRVSKVSYLCTTQLKNGHLFDGTNSLYFTHTESIYIHEDVPKTNQYINRGKLTTFIRGDLEGFPVYINLKENYLYYKTCYGSPVDYFIFKEDLPDINWHITDQTKMLDQFNCIKAYGDFGGRTYDVWFTPDIPINLGPYKLGGLPGLILDANSRDGMVSYEFFTFRSNVTDHPEITIPKIGTIMTREEFKEYKISELLKLEAKFNGGISHNDPPSDWTVEKNKFVIYGPFKEQRRKKNR